MVILRHGVYEDEDEVQKEVMQKLHYVNYCADLHLENIPWFSYRDNILFEG